MRRASATDLTSALRALTGALGPLVDEMPLGVVVFDARGKLASANPFARRLLDGPGGGTLRSTMAELRRRAPVGGSPVEVGLSLGPLGGLRLVAVRGRRPPGAAVLIERNTEERLRGEIRALRALLAAVGQTQPLPATLARTLDAVAPALSASALVFQRTASDALVMAAGHGPVAEFVRGLSPRPLGEARGSSVAHAVRSGRPVHVTTLGSSPFPEDRALPQAASLASLALPLFARGEVVGALQVVGAPGALGEGPLRLAQGLADAVAAGLDRARQDSAIERARAEAAQRERLAALGRMAAGLAHEINNPLTYMSVNLTLGAAELERRRDRIAQMIADPGVRAEFDGFVAELRAVFDECLQGTRRIESLMGALRGMSRNGAGDRVLFDPAQATREAALLFQAAKKGRCDLQLALPTLPKVLGSPGQLGQVVLNLLENGLHAIGGRGRLFVDGGVEGRRVEVRVRDEGPGIPPEIQPRVFEPFFTSKPVGQGTGLGLYISHQIVSGMEGTLSFQTGPGGTTFVVSLPAEAGDVT